MIPPLELASIYRLIDKDLRQFSLKLKQTLSSSDPFLSELNTYLLKLSGKHLRPALTLLVSRMAGDKTSRPIQMALAIELLHTATLIHDDIVDGSLSRRHHESLNARWGDDVSLICGDYIYAKAYAILASLGDPRVNAMFSECTLRICEGEMKQLESRSDAVITESAYLDMIYKKTAALFETACAAAGYLSGYEDESIKHLAEYGKHLGLAFQIVDDCLDLVGKQSVLGKKIGSDFEKNDLTLPLIYLFESQEDSVNLLDNKRHDSSLEDRLKEIQDLAVRSGAVQKSVLKAKAYAEEAETHLFKLPENVYRSSLLQIMKYVMQRANSFDRSVMGATV